MTCPCKENIYCPFVDTATMDKPPCLECEYYYINEYLLSDNNL